MNSTLDLYASSFGLILKTRIAALKVLAERRDSAAPLRNRREQILEVARILMIERGGVSAVTMRGVARATGISPGNLSYYYPNYDSLIDALLEWVIAPYLSEFELLQMEADDDPTDALRLVMAYVLDDLAKKDTTMFFPELWVLTNRDDGPAQKMRKLYDSYVNVLRKLIAEIRPDLEDRSVTELAVFICASIEGQTVFIGYKRPHEEHQEAMKQLALDTMIFAVINKKIKEVNNEHIG